MMNNIFTRPKADG